MTILDAAPRPGTRWPDRLAPLAAGWLGLWGVLALLATITGAGYPFGANDPHGDTNLLRLVPVRFGPALFAALLLAAAVAALAMSRPTGRPSRALRVVLAGYGWAVAAFLALVVPDARVLVILGYAPMLIIGAPFGWPPVDYSDVFTWTLFARFAAVIGGLLLAGAVLVWRRRTGEACVACGRGDAERDWTTPTAAARWGRWAVGIAAAVPLVYASTRFAWVAGVPLGIPQDTFEEMRETGLVWAGAGLGAFATVGAVLTLGLVQRWGERFPRWIVGLAGRRVPVKLAVIPAAVVSVAVTAATLGLMSNPQFWRMNEGFSLASAPALLWPAWGVALGAATYAYHLRRRGACRRCGRG
ncbi:hypothetical protein [Micromonospora avicenniae]|uniref:hypothetical protein n=1 Tax=Micromonospora avicenniae TaxID=1198245 RepID=UPI00332DF691